MKSPLSDLFDRCFGNPQEALSRFREQVKNLALPFDVLGTIREVTLPAYPGYEGGMPPFVYYFVPGTGWGTQRNQPPNPLDPAFVYSCDGIGLNLGCPVRLARALKILFELPEFCRTECLDGLRTPQKHFSTIEELLWLPAWKNPREVRRGMGSSGKKNIDWQFRVNQTAVLLETKFRPADWPRISDQGTHTPMQGFFLGKAKEQFEECGLDGFRIVGITGFFDPCPRFLSICEQDLKETPQVDAVLFRSLLGPTHLLTLKHSILAEIPKYLLPSDPGRYPLVYIFPFHWQQRDQRIENRQDQDSVDPSALSLLQKAIPSRPIRAPFRLPPDPVRLLIQEYRPSGEPVFTVIPKFIDSSQNA